LSMASMSDYTKDWRINRRDGQIRVEERYDFFLRQSNGQHRSWRLRLNQVCTFCYEREGIFE
jgi:hypothetical protein